MASAGVSRSGRVRKKSAKLIEMENEATIALNTNNGVNNSKSPKTVSQTTPLSDILTPISSLTSAPLESSTDDSFGKPLKKKLKIKLSLGMSEEVSQTSVEKCVDQFDETPKRATIPPLKIPKSKLTNLMSPVLRISEPIDKNMSKNLTVDDQTNTQTVIETDNKPNISTNKLKLSFKLPKNSSNFDTNIENIRDESTPQVKREKVELNADEIKSECVPSVSSVTNHNINNIESSAESHKPVRSAKSKSRKREQESAANRLFRQITSGVTHSSNRTSKSSKTSLTMSDVDYTSPISAYEDYDNSAVIPTEELAKKTPSRNKRSRPVKTFESNRREDKKNKKSKKLITDEKPKKKRSVITAYMLWSKEYRSKIQQTSPDMDFADVSRKLGEIWQSMPKNEKTQWKRRAQKLKGSALISTGKPSTSIVNSTKNTLSGSCMSASLDSLSSDEHTESRVISIQPIDVAAHLRFLGESLSIIGNKIKEHSGHIAVSGSLSVLLDTTLCAIGPLLCLTRLEPKMDGCSKETHESTLDNIAHIMPGI